MPSDFYLIFLYVCLLSFCFFILAIIYGRCPL